MRSDMSKVIVERPRWTPHRSTGSAYPRRHIARQWGHDWESAPRNEAMGRVYGGKCLSENLQPLIRFLQKNVGRPWDKVHSEIAQWIACTNTVQKHVLDHLRRIVNEHVEYSGDAVMCLSYAGPQRLFSYGMHMQFYVCPRTRLLRLAPPREPCAAYAAKKAIDPNRHILSRERELRRIHGVWYEITLREIPRDPAANRYAPPEFAIVTKRQLGTREIERRGLSKERGS
ncbi:hypothetical protein [Pendulispora albinea]|uniref:Uncharacterized protein n=1 Tax=Pendulispora albinea TaxID=2741071 RepID=A0ABZ2LWD4_9BACT